NFGCCVCFSRRSDWFITSGYLSREYVGGDYPTALYMSEPGCTGRSGHKQGILSGQFNSCNNMDDAKSVLLCQGC
ncbi:hypothetical protein V8F20_012073, partial [Naviculisporaceae sp. PSN 640]